MPLPHSSSIYNINCTFGQIFPVKEQILVIHDLGSREDVTTAVQTVLLNNKMLNSSSIFLVITASDDEDDDDDNLSSDFNSIIGIQLSENYIKRKQIAGYEADMRLRRPVSCDLKSNIHNQNNYYENEIMKLMLNHADHYNYVPKQRRLSNKLCQITTPSVVTNKLCQITTRSDVTNKLCQITTPRTSQAIWQRRNRQTRFAEDTMDNDFMDNNYQARVPNSQVINNTSVVATDTTIDRPCCCSVVRSVEAVIDKPCCCVNTYFSESRQDCAKRITHDNKRMTKESQVITPVLVQTEFSTEEFCMPKQSSFVSTAEKPFSSISAKLISPDTDHYDVDPLFDQEYTYNTPIPELEENQEITVQSCRCTPEKLRQLLEQVLAEKSLNKTDVCCGSPKHIHFLDIKCSACMHPKRNKENTNNKYGLNKPMNCNCENHDTELIMKNIEAPTLFCLDDPINTIIHEDISKNAYSKKSKLPIGAKQGTISNQKVEYLKNYCPQQKRMNTRESHSEIKARGISDQFTTKTGNNTMIDHSMKFKHANNGQIDTTYLKIKPVPYYENILLASKTKDQIKSELIRALSGFKYLYDSALTKPKVKADSDVVRDAVNYLKYLPANLSFGRCH